VTKFPLAQTVTKRIYKSFADYEVPFRPQQPIAYAQTEGLASYYVGWHRADGRLLRFTKFLLQADAPFEFDLPEPREPGSTLYSPGEQDEGGTLSAGGGAIEYSATEELLQYVRATVFPGGTRAAGRNIQKVPFFEERYVYWPNGRLRERIGIRQDGSWSRWQYDRHGRETKHEKGDAESLADAMAGTPAESTMPH
jgi:hypothetical protein